MEAVATTAPTHVPPTKNCFNCNKSMTSKERKFRFHNKCPRRDITVEKALKIVLNISHSLKNTKNYVFCAECGNKLGTAWNALEQYNCKTHKDSAAVYENWTQRKEKGAPEQRNVLVVEDKFVAPLKLISEPPPASELFNGTKETKQVLFQRYEQLDEKEKCRIFQSVSKCISHLLSSNLMSGGVIKGYCFWCRGQIKDLDKEFSPKEQKTRLQLRWVCEAALNPTFYMSFDGPVPQNILSLCREGSKCFEAIRELAGLYQGYQKALAKLNEGRISLIRRLVGTYFHNGKCTWVPEEEMVNRWCEFASIKVPEQSVEETAAVTLMNNPIPEFVSKPSQEEKMIEEIVNIKQELLEDIHQDDTDMYCDNLDRECAEATVKQEPNITIEHAYVSINRHLSGKEQLFPCSKCPLSFNTLYKRKYHFQKTHEEPKFHCEHENCTLRFPDRPKLKSHIRKKHTYIVTLQCNICARCYRKDVHLQVHMKKFHSHEITRCTRCQMKFRSKEEFQEHLQSEKHLKSLKKVTWKRIIPKKNKIKRDEPYSHLSSPENRTCKLCSPEILFKKVSELYKHERELHPEFKRHICWLCGKTFYQSGTLRKHVERHDDDKKLQVCEQCGKRFLLPSELKKHMFSHTNNFQFYCEHCNEGLNYPHLLRQHLVTKHSEIHLAEKPFVCREVCFMNFATEEEHAAHMKRHEDNRKCKVCGRWFSTLQHLKDHAVTHTREKKFKCHICKRSMARKDVLPKHIKIVHGPNAPYKCEQCGYGFTWKTSLENHGCINPEREAIKARNRARITALKRGPTARRPKPKNPKPSQASLENLELQAQQLLDKKPKAKSPKNVRSRKSQIKGQLLKLYAKRSRNSEIEAQTKIKVQKKPRKSKAKAKKVQPVESESDTS